MKHEIEKAKRGMGKDCYHAEEVLSIAKQFSATRDELYLAARELTKRDFRYEPETREFHKIKRNRYVEIVL